MRQGILGEAPGKLTAGEAAREGKERKGREEGPAFSLESAPLPLDRTAYRFHQAPKAPAGNPRRKDTSTEGTRPGPGPSNYKTCNRLSALPALWDVTDGTGGQSRSPPRKSQRNGPGVTVGVGGCPPHTHTHMQTQQFRDSVKSLARLTLGLAVRQASHANLEGRTGVEA